MSNPRLLGGPYPGAFPYHAAPTKTVYASDMFPASGGSYEKTDGHNAFGDQAYFDMYGMDSGARIAGQGLRVTLGRGTGRQAMESSDYVVTISRGTRAASFDDTARTVTIVATATSTLAQMKTTIDAVAGLSSAYFGGEDGTATAESAAAAFTTRTDFATADKYAWFRVTSDGDGVMFLGTAVPSDNSGSAFIPGNTPIIGMLPPGDELWLRSLSTTDVDGSVEIWEVEQ